LLVELLGPVEAVVAQEAFAQTEWRFPDGSMQPPEVADTAQLMLRFAQGTLGTLELGWANSALVGWDLQVNGERGTLAARAPRTWFPTSGAVELLQGSEAGPLVPVEVDDPDRP